MRISSRLAAVALLLTLTSPIWGQQAVGFGGVNPAAIVNQPIAIPSSSSSISSIPLFDHSVHLQDFMPHLATFSNKPVIGQSVYPTPENMPGLNYLKAFGFSQPSVQTTPPVTQKKKGRLPPALLLSRPENATNTSK
jgi:hypothetical protein